MIDYHEDAQCPNRLFHRRRELLVKDLEEPFVYNCGCGCKFEWYNEESCFILEQGNRQYEEHFYAPVYRPQRVSKFTDTVNGIIIITSLAAISAIGLLALKILLTGL